jgi:hypothetical protein
VKQNDLGEYEENAREKQKDTHIQFKSQAPSPRRSNQAIGMGNTKPPPATKQNKNNQGVW